jgi:hypothetical protein
MNQRRLAHGSPALVWSSQLANNAEFGLDCGDQQFDDAKTFGSSEGLAVLGPVNNPTAFVNGWYSAGVGHQRPRSGRAMDLRCP